MSTVSGVPLKVSAVAACGEVLPSESTVAEVLPRSAAVGRAIGRIRRAESERRELQQEAERLLKAGRVMQRD